MPRHPGRGGSCRPCKERHVKCDRAMPSCSNCTRSKYLQNCIYESPKFRFRTRVLSSASGDDGRNIRSSDQQHTSSKSAPAGDCRDAESPRPLTISTPSAGNDVAPETVIVQDSPWSSSTSNELPLQYALPDAGMSAPADAVQGDPSENTAAAQAGLTTPCLPYSALSGPVHPHPVSDRTEAYIFSFYLETAGPWLDIVSPSRLFGIHVPRVAASEPVLHSACLAYASHVLYLHNRVPVQVKEDLHDRALRQLIPLLTSRPRGRALDPILATTVLLRMTEQFLEPDEDRQHHLYGSSTLFETGYDDWSLFDDSLSNTSFWAYLRGSIRVSFLREQPCPFKLDHLTVWEYASKDAILTDEAHTNVITYLLAELCTVCWGKATSSETAMSNMNRLEHAISDWKNRLPASFQPWYLEFNEGDTFPDIRYLAPWHYVAWQFYYAAQIMLAVHSSAIRNETNVFGLTRLLEEKVASPNRWLCGVTISSNDYGVKINGSHLVAWSAQLITGRAEQSKVLELLVSLWEETRWPNQTCCARLRGLWNGSRRSWTKDS